MKLKSAMVLLISLSSMAASAQTADEIIAKYFENTGGKTKWEALKGTRTTAKANMRGMELPMVITRMSDGRQLTTMSFQGNTVRQGVFDGKTLWSDNFMSQKPEKSDAESTENYKTSLNDFPSPFLNYQAKGYKVELIGKETIEGTETFKLKLTKKPIQVDGKATENIEFYYFDAENFVPVIVEAEVRGGGPMRGPMAGAKGAIGQTKMSDYQDVNGLLFPFSMTRSVKGQPGGQTITITAIELDPKVEASAFAFPEEKK